MNGLRDAFALEQSVNQTALDDALRLSSQTAHDLLSQADEDRTEGEIAAAETREETIQQAISAWETFLTESQADLTADIEAAAATLVQALIDNAVMAQTGGEGVGLIDLEKLWSEDVWAAWKDYQVGNITDVKAQRDAQINAFQTYKVAAAVAEASQVGAPVLAALKLSAAIIAAAASGADGLPLIQDCPAAVDAAISALRC